MVRTYIYIYYKEICTSAFVHNWSLQMIVKVSDGRFFCFDLKSWWHKLAVWLRIWTLLYIATLAKLPKAITARTRLLVVGRPVGSSSAQLSSGVKVSLHMWIFIATIMLVIMVVVANAWYSGHYWSFVDQKLTVEAERICGIDIARVVVNIDWDLRCKSGL